MAAMNHNGNTYPQQQPATDGQTQVRRDPHESSAVNQDRPKLKRVMVPVNMGSDEESGGDYFTEDHDSAPLAENHHAGMSRAGSGSKKGETIIGTSTRGKATNSISEGNTKADKLSGIKSNKHHRAETPYQKNNPTDRSAIMDGSNGDCGDAPTGAEHASRSEGVISEYSQVMENLSPHPPQRNAS